MTDDATLVARLTGYNAYNHGTAAAPALLREAASRIDALQARNAALCFELETVLNATAGLPEALASSERKLAAAQKLAEDRGTEVERLRAALRPFAEAGAEAIRQHGSKNYNFEQVLRDICSHFSLRMFKTAYFALKDSAT